jgi:hypothetical protein
MQPLRLSSSTSVIVFALLWCCLCVDVGGVLDSDILRTAPEPVDLEEDLEREIDELLPEEAEALAHTGLIFEAVDGNATDAAIPTPAVSTTPRAPALGVE